MNPYWNQSFLGFFVVLFKRITGQLPLSELATDEVQLLVLMGVAVSTIALGTFLTLKKMTMMANSLSHTTLLGIVLTSMICLSKGEEIQFNSMMLFISAFISALLTTFLTEFVRYRLKLQEDASIGLVFTTLFALGIILVTIFTRNSHIGIEVIMGNVDALHPTDIGFVWNVAFLNLALIFVFFRQWVMIAFDEKLSSSLGISTRLVHYLMMFLTSLTILSAFRAVGVVLVLNFIVGPALIARLWCQRVFPLLCSAILIGIGCSILGVALSRHFLSIYQAAFSTGGLVVILISLIYLVSALLTFRLPQGLILNK